LRPKSIPVLIAILLIVGVIPTATAKEAQQYTYRTTYVFENRGTEPHTLTEDDVTLMLFANDEWQSVTTKNATHEIKRLDRDEDGNDIAVMDLPLTIQGGTTITFSIDYDISSSNRPRPSIDPAQAGGKDNIPQDLVVEYCIETETFTWNEEIEALAARLAGEQNTVLETVTSMIEWMIGNLTYGNNEVPQYPNSTLAYRRGDCDDQAILLISLLRSQGIPAILQLGIVFSEAIDSERTSWGGHLTSQQKGVGWHGWTMIYIPPWGWLPVDLTLSASRNPLELIEEAPEYDYFVVTALNVSKQQYIGDSRRSREELMSSDLYIIMKDEVITRSSGTDWLNLLYIGMGILTGGTLVFYVIYSYRRNRSYEDAYTINSTFLGQSLVLQRKVERERDQG
jgi:transglutaminase-like putative cysteine protease